MGENEENNSGYQIVLKYSLLEKEEKKKNKRRLLEPAHLYNRYSSSHMGHESGPAEHYPQPHILQEKI